MSDPLLCVYYFKVHRLWRKYPKTRALKWGPRAAHLCRTASLRLVFLNSSSALTSAPLEIRKRTTSICSDHGRSFHGPVQKRLPFPAEDVDVQTLPSDDATCSGVRFSASHIFTLSF